MRRQLMGIFAYTATNGRFIYLQIWHRIGNPSIRWLQCWLQFKKTNTPCEK